MSTFIHIYIYIYEYALYRWERIVKNLYKRLYITNTWYYVGTISIYIIITIIIIFIIRTVKENSIYFIYIYISDGRCSCETKGVRFRLMMCVLDKFIFFFVVLLTNLPSYQLIAVLFCFLRNTLLTFRWQKRYFYIVNIYKQTQTRLWAQYMNHLPLILSKGRVGKVTQFIVNGLHVESYIYKSKFTLVNV